MTPDVVTQSVTQAALLAKEAALQAAEEYRVELEATEREKNVNRANNTVIYAREHLGIELTANPEDGTAKADGMTFWYVLRDHYPDLLVEAICPDCGEANWKEVNTLAELGDIINNGMKARSYRHSCTKPEPQSGLATFKKLNKYAAEAIDRERQIDDFGKAAIVFALLAVADEIATLRRAWVSQQPLL